MHKPRFAIALVSACLIGACSPSTSQPSASGEGAAQAPIAPPTQPVHAIDQNRLCEVTGWQHDVAKEYCEPGQKIVYLPESWGNDQLPILFAAVNCDLRYSVALTKGAVTCVYAPIDVETKSSPSLPLGPLQMPPQS